MLEHVCRLLRTLGRDRASAESLCKVLANLAIAGPHACLRVWCASVTICFCHATLASSLLLCQGPQVATPKRSCVELAWRHSSRRWLTTLTQCACSTTRFRFCGDLCGTVRAARDGHTRHAGCLLHFVSDLVTTHHPHVFSTFTHRRSQGASSDQRCCRSSCCSHESACVAVAPSLCHLVQAVCRSYATLFVLADGHEGTTSMTLLTCGGWMHEQPILLHDYV